MSDPFLPGARVIFPVIVGGDTTARVGVVDSFRRHGWRNVRVNNSSVIEVPVKALRKTP